MGLLDFFGGGADAPDPIDPRKLGRQTTQVQEQFLGDRQRLRGKFGGGIVRQSLGQIGQVQQGLSGIGQDIVGDISRDRASLSGAGADLLRQQSQGFAGAERLQALLQQQAEQGLQRAGQLSPEQMRDVDQGVFGRLAGQGRGAGAHGLGQLALGRQGAIQANEDRARQFAQQTTQSGLAVSNPLQRIFAQDAGTIGSKLGNLQNAQGIAGQNQIDFNPISANVNNIAQFNSQQQAQQAQASASGFGDIVGGALSLAGTAFGGPIGGAIGSALGGAISGGGSGSGMSRFGGAFGSQLDPSTGGVMNMFGQSLFQGPRNQ